MPAATASAFFVFFLSCALGQQQQDEFLARTDRSYSGLSRVVYWPDGGDLFLAGTNVLARVDAVTLREEERVSTGPRPDSAACHASGCSTPAHNLSRVLTDDVNKVLVLDAAERTLVACGSLYQGACTKYTDLGDLNGKAEFVPEPVVANDATSSTFAFIGPQRSVSLMWRLW